MLGRPRTALLIVSLLSALALLIVGSVMLSNAAVTLADFVPGFSAGGILLGILALLVWLVRLWFQSSDLWLVRSGGYLVMATVVFVGFSAGSVAKTLSGASDAPGTRSRPPNGSGGEQPRRRRFRPRPRRR